MMGRRTASVAGALFLAGVAGAAWFGFAATPHGADPANPRLVALGEKLYAEHCASCHGAHLEGQPNWKERLPNGRLPAPPHSAEGHTWHHPDRQLFEITRNGASGVLPGYQSDMPAFKDVLSDREIWAVLSFIESTWPSETRERQQRMSRRAD